MKPDQPKRKRGRPLEDGERRVRLYAGGPHVKQQTKAFLSLCGPLYGVPIGRVIDALVALSVSQGITFKLPIKGRRKWRGVQSISPKEPICPKYSPLAPKEAIATETTSTQ